MELASDSEIRKIPDLVQELFDHVLFDEQSVFVSDEATIWDVSMLPEHELLARCSCHYGVTVSRADLGLPLGKLLRQIDERRNTQRQDSPE